MISRRQNSKRDGTKRNVDSVDFFDIRSRSHFAGFQQVPMSGNDRIRITAKAMDRGRYNFEKTGFYDDDPIRLNIHLGDRLHTIDLPDDHPMDIQLEEWLAAGTRLDMTYPTAEHAASILRPIAERAWRRKVDTDELKAIVRLVETRAPRLGDIEALKEGIVAILVSPSFLLINADDVEAADRFATKLSHFLKSAPPNDRIRKAAAAGEFDTFESVRSGVKRFFEQNEADEFLREFPHSWLELDHINFMAPDPEQFRLYDRKRLSDDMVNEVLHFFRHAVDNNIPVPEFLSADYSFLNAGLAKVYNVDGIAQDSSLRKHTFADGRRGGLPGTGASLTFTADCLGTWPIHRAVYVMANLLGIHPSPPRPDVKIEEPDVCQAKTIKEILQAHTTDRTCASCHLAIDPFGYARDSNVAAGQVAAGRRELRQRTFGSLKDALINQSPAAASGDRSRQNANCSTASGVP